MVSAQRQEGGDRVGVPGMGTDVPPRDMEQQGTKDSRMRRWGTEG